MFLLLILIFTVIPVTELLLLIELGKAIGTWPTIFVVLGTGVVGALLAKAQGFMILNRIRNELQRGSLPAREMISGLCVLVGGVLLITPGLLTDAAGLALLLPPVHYLVVEAVRRWLAAKIRRRGFYFQFGRPGDSWEEEDNR